MNKLGVFVGRFCPVHLGHEKIIEDMLKECHEHSLIVVGSSNAPLTLRNFFSYRERKEFIGKVLGPKNNIKIVGLPDYSTDDEWIGALDDIIRLCAVHPRDVVFYGGCEEEIQFLLDRQRNCKIVNRFDGTTPKISATEVRDALIHDRPLGNLLNPVIAQDVKNLFAQKWDRFRKM